MTTTIKDAVSPHTLDSALDWRYAVKRFDPARKIAAADWATLRHSLVKAPSSFGLQPYRFVVVESPALREKLKGAAWNQTQLTDASHIVVALARAEVTPADVKRYVDRIAQVRGVTVDSLKGYHDMMVGAVGAKPVGDHLGWAQKQAYIAIGFLLETAALLRIDATPMEGFDPAAFDQLLGLAGTPWRSTAVVALGYRHEEDGYAKLKKVRAEEGDLIEVR